VRTCGPWRTPTSDGHHGGGGISRSSKRTTARTFTMKNSLLSLITAAIATSAIISFSLGVVDSFSPQPSSSRRHPSPSSAFIAIPASSSDQPLLAALNDEPFASSDHGFLNSSDNDDDDVDITQYPLRSAIHRSSTTRRRSKFLSAIRQKTKPITLAILTAATTTFLPRGGSSINFLAISPARASAPIVLRAAQKKDDPPMIQALKKAEEIKKQRSLEEFDAFMAQANDIELSQGKTARATYESEYQQNKAIVEAQKSRDILLLKRQLLDAGQDPHTDIDAERQVFLLEHNVDLEKISGTPQNERMIKNFQKRGKNAPTYQHQRYIIACQVADLKARGIDPMEYFAQPENMQKTRSIYKMEDGVAERVAKQYETLMAEYGGRLTPKKEGEVPYVYPDLNDGDATTTSKSSSASTTGGSTKQQQDKAAAKAKRTAEKEALRQARAEAKAQSRADRMALASQAKAERAAAKERKLAEKAALSATAIAATSTAAEEAMTSAISAAEDAVIAADTIESDIMAVTSSSDTAITTTSTSTAVTTILSNIQSKATPKNIGTVVIGGGVATYAYNYFQENNAGAQKERERQLKLILGKDEDDDDEEEDDDDDDGEDG
jgi:hypothetical protein